MHPFNFGKFLRDLREERGWTQGEIAEKLGISRQAVFLLETGRGFPSVPLAIRIARLCRRSLDDMFSSQYSQEGKEVNMNRGWFDPFFELDRLHREIDRMFSASFRPFMRREGEGGEMIGPAVNIRQTDKDIIIEAELPGVTAKDLQLNITENTVSLRGERRTESKKEEGDLVRQEVRHGSFAREITLPTAVKAEEAEANLKNGLLTIRVPKKETAPRGRELTIREE